MARFWPFGRRKRARPRRRSTKDKKAEHDLQEAKRRARRREEFLAELRETDQETYKQVMFSEFNLGGLFEQAQWGGDGLNTLEGPLGEAFQVFLTEKLLQDEGDALDKVLERIQKIKEIESQVEPRSTEGVAGLVSAVAEVLKGPIGNAFAKAMMAGNPSRSLPQGMPVQAMAMPAQQGPASLPAQAQREEEMPMLPDWIPLDKVVTLLDRTPEEAAMEVLRYAQEMYDSGDGRAFEGIATLTQIPVPIVRITLNAYRPSPQYGAYVSALLAKGEWVDGFLAALKAKFEAYEEGGDVWTTTPNTEAEPQPFGL